MIRIANGQGFWGDWQEAPVRLVEQGPIDYLTLDYLAEVTMAILQKQRQRDPQLGYARDFPPLIGRLAEQLRERGVRVLANAGGLNPVGCAREIRRLAPALKVAVVLGDDATRRIDEFIEKGYPLANMDTGEPVSAIQASILSANAYIGAFPLAEALATGADVVVSGRCADAALTLAPAIHRFGWRREDIHLLSAGMAAGHIIECGAQATGGNSHAHWQSIEDMDEIGYPIVEMHQDGTFEITKHPGTGGRVDSHIITEQILYEIGDPRAYYTPDCIVDFTSLKLKDVGADRVRVSRVKGAPPSENAKLSINYAAGWKALGTLVYPWPEALAKARAADKIVRRRIQKLGLALDEIHTEYLGASACFDQQEIEPGEVQLRIGVRGHDRAAVERFTRELIPLVLSGPPGATGYGEGRSIEEMAERSQAHYDLARSIRPDVILLAHGAALSGPDTAQYMVDHTDCHG
ncbi:MAG: acyclic terpene utilization AtuA family protein, partial [bacterium]|nr:acyclic terpene utilization AtuA family protein [bacterium]